MNSSEQNNSSHLPYDNENEEIDLKEILYKGIEYWRWFVVGIVLALLLAFFYLWQATPIYEVEAKVIVNEEGQPTVNLGGMEQLLMMRTPKGNLDNEIEIIRSHSSLLVAIEELGLYIRTYDESKWITEELYKAAPLHVDLSPMEANKLLDPIEIEYTLYPNQTLYVKAYPEGEKKNKESIREATFEKLPAVLSTPMGNITFSYRTTEPKEAVRVDSLSNKATLSDSEEVKEQRYKVIIQRPQETAKLWAKKLTVAPTDKKTTIARMTIEENLPERGREFLNTLIRVYNHRANETKNEVAKKTEQFIDQRIQIIDKELGSTEEQLEQFKRSARMTDITSDAQMALTESSEYEKKRVENETQIQLIQALNEYVMHQGEEPAILPVNVGIINPSLVALIGQYNELVIERSRLLKSSSETNPAVINVNLTLESLLTSIKATISSVQNGLMITKQTLDEQAGIFTQRISEAPAKERQYVSISRQQEIKSGLYLMLLQKREENAIALAATEDFARIIDPPMMAGTGPVAPKKAMILMSALLLGLLFPTLLIFAKEFFQNRITSLEEVERKSKSPIMGKVYKQEHLAHPLVVHANENSLIMERFRDLRTNILFTMGEENQKVLLVTSTVPSEGKTFTAVNLAASIALLNKKVIIVGLDIRKPQLALIFGFSPQSKGVTDYLSNPNLDLKTLIHKVPEYPHLDTLHAGTIPPNPAELLSKQALEDLIEILRAQYDYIIIDSAPIGLVTDTQLIARVADASLYVCRVDYSFKSNLDIANQLYTEKRLPQMGLVVNGLDIDKMRRYGYGYGTYAYGMEEDPKKKLFSFHRK